MYEFITVYEAMLNSNLELHLAQTRNQVRFIANVVIFRMPTNRTSNEGGQYRFND